MLFLQCLCVVVNLIAVQCTYYYVQCYTDGVNSKSVISATGTDFGVLSTVDKCAQYCSGYTYFGITGTYCRCGNTLSVDNVNGIMAIAESWCNAPCAGNSSQICGGTNILSLYTFTHSLAVTVSTSAPTHYYVQCVSYWINSADPLNDVYIQSTPINSVEFCARACSAYKYFGMCYGICHCGNSLTYPNRGILAIPENLCYAVCPADGGEICGGNSAISIYTTDNTLAVKSSTTPPQYYYVQCYTTWLFSANLMPDYDVWSVGFNNVDSCARMCSGYQYFGLEYMDCYCSNSLGNAFGLIALPDSACNLPCPGNSSQNCGIYWGVAVFTYSAGLVVRKSTTPPPYYYLQCYNDNAASRVLPDATSAYGLDYMSVDTCARLCASFQYFAASSSRDCHCGNTLNGGTPKSETNCSMPCYGNSTQLCGGILGLSLYTLNYTKFTSTPFYYKQCYSDITGSNLLQSFNISLSYMTVNLCSRLCAAYKYFGVEASTYCYCGNSLSSSVGNVPIAESNCKAVCAGNSSQICGGTNIISVYTFNTTLKSAQSLNVSTSYYKQCFSDYVNSASTLQGASLSLPFMTNDICSRICSSFLYFGTEAGSQCYCGNSIISPSPVSENSCNTPCLGNSSQICGGMNRTSIYSYNSSLAISLPLPNYYKQCYSDNIGSVQILQGPSNTTVYMTVDACAKFCTSYVFFGLENSNTCYCGNSLNIALGIIPIQERYCNATCVGNSSQICGGTNSISLYTFNSSLTTSFSTNPIYYYKQCFGDNVNNTRLLQGAAFSLPYMTSDVCASICSSFLYFGTEAGNQCYCGNSIVSSFGLIQLTETACSTFCSGNLSQICGGSSSISVFSFNSGLAMPALINATYYSMQCYNDSNPRVLQGSSVISNYISIDTCARICSAFSYFGTENSGECYCGNSINGGQIVNAAYCNLTCKGNSSQICGGSGFLSLYSLMPIPVSSTTGNLIISSTTSISSSTSSRPTTTTTTISTTALTSSQSTSTPPTTLTSTTTTTIYTTTSTSTATTMISTTTPVSITTTLTSVTTATSVTTTMTSTSTITSITSTTIISTATTNAASTTPTSTANAASTTPTSTTITSTAQTSTTIASATQTSSSILTSTTQTSTTMTSTTQTITTTDTQTSIASIPSVYSRAMTSSATLDSGYGSATQSITTAAVFTTVSSGTTPISPNNEGLSTTASSVRSAFPSPSTSTTEISIYNNTQDVQYSSVSSVEKLSFTSLSTDSSAFSMVSSESTSADSGNSSEGSNNIVLFSSLGAGGVLLLAGGLLTYRRLARKKPNNSNNASKSFSNRSTIPLQLETLSAKSNLISSAAVASVSNTISSVAVSSINQSLNMTKTYSINATSVFSIPGFKENRESDFSIDSSIDDGSSGSVKAATAINPELKTKLGGRLLAVKLMKDVPEQDFLHEVAVMERFKSPNVVQLIGFCRFPPCLLMFRYQMSLKDVIASGNVPIESALTFARDIARGLTEIHRKDVIHFDIKPHNVLLEEDLNAPGNFRCAIADFGAAAIVRKGGSTASIVAGMQDPTTYGLTLCYAAPELLKAKGRTRAVCTVLDKAIDVYALSITFYEMICQTFLATVLSETSVPELMHLVMSGNRPDLSIDRIQEFEKVTSIGISELLSAAWQDNPRSRPQASEIYQFLTSEPGIVSKTEVQLSETPYTA